MFKRFCCTAFILGLMILLSACGGATSTPSRVTPTKPPATLTPVVSTPTSTVPSAVIDDSINPENECGAIYGDTISFTGSDGQSYKLEVWLGGGDYCPHGDVSIRVEQSGFAIYTRPNGEVQTTFDLFRDENGLPKFNVVVFFTARRIDKLVVTEKGAPVVVHTSVIAMNDNSVWPPLENENADQYLNIPHLQNGNLSNPYIKGKIVIMDKGNYSPISGTATDQLWNGDYFDAGVLNSICEGEGVEITACQTSSGGGDKLIARTPKEVGTIIWVDCTRKNVGSYSPRGTAYQTTCVVTIIDKSKNLIVGRASFGPTDPPTMIYCAVDTNIECAGYGPVPRNDIAKFILSLPRK